MRTTIFGAADGWHTRDLLRVLETLGCPTNVVDFRRIDAMVGLNNREWMNCDAAIVRTMPAGSLEQVVFRMNVLHRMHDGDVRLLNPPRALEICIDKYLAAARLEAAGLPVPKTIVCQCSEDAMPALEQLGGDVVVKPIFGSEGRGMLRVSNPDMAWRVFRTLERMQHVIYLQQFISHPGWDLRIFVLDNRIVTAMKRYSDDWRTNIAQGGVGERVEVDDFQAQLALRAADATGAIAAGVDLLKGADGMLYVLEVNAVPGWRTLAKVCKIDVAEVLIRWLISQT